MDIQTLTSFFGWCTIINAGFFLFVTLFITIAPDLVYRLQIKFLPISRDTYNVVIYSFLGLVKIFLVVFNVVPYVALRLVG